MAMLLSQLPSFANPVLGTKLARQTTVIASRGDRLYIARLKLTLAGRGRVNQSFAVVFPSRVSSLTVSPSVTLLPKGIDR